MAAHGAWTAGWDADGWVRPLRVGGRLSDASVASLNRPGGNVTGNNMVSSTIEAKRSELLHEFAPSALTIGVIIDSNYSGANFQAKALQGAAANLA